MAENVQATKNHEIARDVEPAKVSNKFLRDCQDTFSYGFTWAVEILRNSIGAGARNGRVGWSSKPGAGRLEVDDVFHVSDDGCGFTPRQLYECMGVAYSRSAGLTNDIGKWGRGSKAFLSIGDVVMYLSACKLGGRTGPSYSVGLMSIPLQKRIESETGGALTNPLCAFDETCTPIDPDTLEPMDEEHPGFKKHMTNRTLILKHQSIFDFEHLKHELQKLGSHGTYIAVTQLRPDVLDNLTLIAANEPPAWLSRDADGWGAPDLRLHNGPAGTGTDGHYLRDLQLVEHLRQSFVKDPRSAGPMPVRITVQGHPLPAFEWREGLSGDTNGHEIDTFKAEGNLSNDAYRKEFGQGGNPGEAQPEIRFYHGMTVADGEGLKVDDSRIHESKLPWGSDFYFQHGPVRAEATRYNKEHVYCLTHANEQEKMVGNKHFTGGETGIYKRKRLGFGVAQKITLANVPESVLPLTVTKNAFLPGNANAERLMALCGDRACGNRPGYKGHAYAKQYEADPKHGNRRGHVRGKPARKELRALFADDNELSQRNGRFADDIDLSSRPAGRGRSGRNSKPPERLTLGRAKSSTRRKAAQGGHNKKRKDRASDVEVREAKKACTAAKKAQAAAERERDAEKRARIAAEVERGNARDAAELAKKAQVAAERERADIADQLTGAERDLGKMRNALASSVIERRGEKDLKDAYTDLKHKYAALELNSRNLTSTAVAKARADLKEQLAERDEQLAKSRREKADAERARDAVEKQLASLSAAVQAAAVLGV